MICSLGGPLSHGSPVVVFLDRGDPRFWNFYSSIPVDVVGVKSCMNSLFDPSVAGVDILRPELVLLARARMSVARATQRSNLAQEGALTIQTRPVRKLLFLQIIDTNTSRPWDTSWYNRYDSVFAKKKLLISLIVIIQIFPVSSATPRIGTCVRV